MKKTTIVSIEKIGITVKKNGGTAIIIAKECNGKGKSEKEEITRRIQISAIIKSIIAGIEIKKTIEGEIAEESIATISHNGSTELLVCLNPNGNNGEIKVEAEVRTPIASSSFLLTQILLQDNERIINLQMIQETLKKNPELANACEKLFFSKTIVAYN